MTIPSIAPYPLPTANALPPSRAPFRADPERAVLLVHDMQQHFADFFTADADPLRGAVAHMAALCRDCRRWGVPVMYTRQPADDPAARGLLNVMWGPGLSGRPARAPIIDPLRPETGDTVIEKMRYSAFFGSDLQARMVELGRNQLWVCGVYAHIGCMVTAYDAFMRDIEPFMVADALADFSAEDHGRALAQIGNNCGVVTTTAALQAALRARGGPAAQEDGGVDAQAIDAELCRLLNRAPADLCDEAELRDLGMDSIRMMSLVEWLEDRGVMLDAMDLVDCESLAHLRTAIADASR